MYPQTLYSTSTNLLQNTKYGVCMLSTRHAVVFGVIRFQMYSVVRLVYVAICGMFC